MSKKTPNKSRPLRPILIITELFFTAGLVLAGFLLWQGVQVMQVVGSQTAAVNELRETWLEQEPDTTQITTGSILSGQGFAVLELPSIDPNFQRVIAEGIESSVLDDPKSGIGHYPQTAMPWDDGNFAIAGHRMGNGNPFRDLNLLAVGDEIRVSVGDTTWVYEVTHSHVVGAKQTSVLNASAGKNTITLTTCHPMWNWKERLVVHGDLVSVIETPGITS